MEEDICPSCQFLKKHHRLPNCDFCNTLSDELSLTGMVHSCSLYPEYQPGRFVHSVCLKGLASFLYLHTDDEFFSLSGLKEVVEIQSGNEETTVSGQLFCSNFVPFFRNHFVPVKHQFHLLTEQLVRFENELLSYRPFLPTNASIVLTNNRTCEFCNSNSKLLVKCQHKNCFRFCHMSCFLDSNHQRGIHVFFNNSSVALLYYCKKSQIRLLSRHHQLPWELVSQPNFRICSEPVKWPTAH